jgi:hypothetical protein
MYEINGRLYLTTNMNSAVCKLLKRNDANALGLYFQVSDKNVAATLAFDCSIVDHSFVIAATRV